MPFVDQLAGANRALITAEYGEIRDIEAAKRFGARFIQEFSYWGWKSCAIACVMMVLKSEGLYEGNIFDLISEGLLINGYAFKNLRGRKNIGWKHESLCRLMKVRGLNAKTFRNKSARELAAMLENGSYVIASIRSKTGGHMILLTGLSGDDFFFNDPFIYGGGGENKKISMNEFDKIFLGGGIEVWK
ncbi:MAG: papain-like cysteine protease family protein [bacterium]